MKVNYSKDNICAFGGLNFTDKLIKDHGIFDVIDNTLVVRGVLVQYKYSDLFRSLLSLTLCGGKCAEDISEHLRTELAQIPDFKVCSADTLVKKILNFDYPTASGWSIRQNFSNLKVGNRIFFVIRRFYAKTSFYDSDASIGEFKY
jgi:hypothetical protein